MVTWPVTEVLRHQSAASTRPYITDTARGSARLASLAITMSVATAGRPSAAGADGRDAISAAAPRKRAGLLTSLYTLPQESTISPPGLLARCPTSVRQLLTALHIWRGPGAYMSPAFGPTCASATPARGRSSSWAVAFAQLPLLLDAQLLSLFCEGSPETRPTIDTALASSSERR
jgi:hypothetical protein